MLYVGISFKIVVVVASVAFIFEGATTVVAFSVGTDAFDTAFVSLR